MWPGEGDLVFCIFEDNMFDPAAREEIEWRSGKRFVFIAGVLIFQENDRAPERRMIGKRFQERIEESIRSYNQLIIVLSEMSAKSGWVRREIEAVDEREIRENRTILFPIRIDDAVMEASQPWLIDIRRERRRIYDFAK